MPVSRSRKNAEFLFAAAAACTTCPGMEGRRRVLSWSNGPLTARLLVVAEAPGARGAERTGVPLSGDRSGDNFDSLLDSCGLSRERVFVTNAVICNPQSPNGANRRPTRTEIAACSDWLAKTIALVDPLVVATLGAVALGALETICPHGLSLAYAGRPWAWFGRTLFPLYHPSPRVVNSHRRWPQQVADWQRLAQLVENGGS